MQTRKDQHHLPNKKRFQPLPAQINLVLKEVKVVKIKEARIKTRMVKRHDLLHRPLIRVNLIGHSGLSVMTKRL